MQFDIDSPESVRCWLEGTCGIELTALQGKVMSLKVGQAETPRFAAEQIEFFNTNGYLSGPCVLSDEQIDTLKRPIDDIVKGRVDFPKHLKTGGDLASTKIVNLFRHDPVFEEIKGTPAIGALAHDLLEAPVRIWEDQMILKTPFERETALAWHQDYTYWNHVAPAK